MMNRLSLCLVLLCCAIPVFGDTLYMTAGDQTTFIAFNTISGTVSGVFSETASQYAIAVSGGTVRLAGTCCSNSTGMTYNLSGAATGPSLTSPNPIPGGGFAFDGTTDGTHNYAVAFNGNGVYEFNLDWTNPQFLFTQPYQFAIGSAYDPTNNSLWIGGRTGAIIDYSMTGTALSTFVNPLGNVGTNQNCCGSGLALDSAGNLWENSSGTLYEMSKTGTVLGTFSTGINDNFLGLEAAESGAAPDVPEPASLMLLGTGMLAVGRKLRHRSAR